MSRLIFNMPESKADIMLIYCKLTIRNASMYHMVPVINAAQKTQMWRQTGVTIQ